MKNLVFLVGHLLGLVGSPCAENGPQDLNVDDALVKDCVGIQFYVVFLLVTGGEKNKTKERHLRNYFHCGTGS